jgi:hypothetical protein
MQQAHALYADPPRITPSGRASRLRARLPLVAALVLGGLSLSACATQEYVDQQIAIVNGKISAVDAKATEAGAKADQALAAAQAAQSAAQAAQSAADAANSSASQANQKADALSARMEEHMKKPRN